VAAEKARFEASISNGQNGSISLGLYPKIKAPSSKMTSAPKPKLVSSVEMQALLKTRSQTAFSHVWGLTVGTFSLQFTDLTKQWVKNDAGRWQFQGGAVQLTVANNIYIDQDMVGSNAKLGGELIGLIMTHELLHVQDNIDVISNDGPTEVANDSIVRKLLIDGGNGEPAIVEEREYTHWVIDETKDPDGNACSYLTDRMIGLLADKLNAKQLDRDSGPAYADYGRSVSLLKQNPRRR